MRIFSLRIATCATICLFGLFIVLLAGCGEDGPGIELVEMLPDGEITRTSNLTFVFTDEVVPDSLLNVPLEKPPVVFEPALPGPFQWIAPNKLRFYPDVMLAPSTQYIAKVQRRVLAAYGKSLQGEATLTFETARLRINSAFVSFDYDGASNRQARLVSTIEFNHEVEPQDAAKHLSLRYRDGGSIPFEVTTATPSTVIALRSAVLERGDDEREIHLRIEKGLQALGGNQGLADVYVRPANLPEKDNLKVEQLTAVREAATSQVIKVHFNLPVPADGIRPYITIKPDVEVQASSNHTTLRLSGNFDAEKSYKVTLREGLRAIDGSALKRAYTANVNFLTQDIPPQIDFVGDGFYLNRSGNLNLGLATVNVGEVELEIDKVYANNLVYALNQYDFDAPDGYWNWRAGVESMGRQLYKEEITVPVQRNEEVVTPVAVNEYLRDQHVGLFKITAREKDRRWHNASRWVVATDLGMIAKEAGDDLWVWVNTLSTLSPVRGAEITLYSQSNQPLSTTRTDERGIALFEDYQQFDESMTPYVVVASLGDDLSFVELTRRRITTADYDVGGSAYLLNGYESFVYNERGVYRPGETAHLATIVRGPNATVPQPFPVRLKISGPDGRVLTEQRTRLNAQGGAGFTIPVPDYALTGVYQAALMIGQNDEIGRTTFNVEEFVPDRMKVKVETNARSYRPGEALQVDIEGLTLFGPPAAGRTVQTSVEIEPYAFAPPNYATFAFGDTERGFNSVKTELEERRLDEAGRTRFSYAIPRDLKPPASLRAVVEATVLEPGGRGVTAYSGAVVHPYTSYIGLRQRANSYAEPGKPFPVDVVLLDPEGNPLPGHTLKATLYNIYWNTVWQRGNDGRYRYKSDEVINEESVHTVTSSDGIGQFSVRPATYGRYRLVVEDPQTGAATALEFYSSGWGNTAWAMDTPDRVELELDKEVYAAGETAQVLVRAPFTGKLLLTVEREQVFDQQVITLDGNTATVDVPVTDAYKPNVYISAHLIRTVDGLERDEAARAFGVVPLMVDASANRLAVEIDAVQEMRPRNKLEVDLKVEGGNGKPFVTIAAVDEGITQLTDFRTPDPHGFFFGKKRLQVDTYDLYGMILPEITSSLSTPAGDVEAARKRRVSPVAARRVKPIAYWSGVLETDRRGRASVTFDIPQFNGTIKLMAVAYAGNRFGSDEQKVVVRDEIVMTPTLPRFVGSGDDFVVPVSVYNGTGSDASFDVKLEAEGPVRLAETNNKRVRVQAGQEGQVYFKVTADRTLGKATFTLSASGGAATTRDEVEVPVRPPVPYTVEAGSGSIQAGTVARIDVPSSFLEGTEEFELKISSFPAVRFAGSLQYLLKYPHGCIEQTTSKLFPLLAFDDLARLAEPELFASNGADYFIEEGIAKLERMQQPSGAFSYWPGSYVNDWSSIYTAHFLVEARRAGYTVSETVYDRMLAAVGQQARGYRLDEENSLEQSAYAVYVLALASKPDRSTQSYLKNTALDKLPTASRYHLAGAFAHSGDKAAARQLLPQGAAPPPQISDRQTGGNLNSSIRARAIMLDILAEIEPGSAQVPGLVESLSRSAAEGRWYTTQENAFAFLALGKIFNRQANTNYTGTVKVDGRQVATFNKEDHRVESKEWRGKTVTLDISGSGTAYYYWAAEGLPAALSVDEYDRDLRVRRRYLSERGSPFVTGTTFEQGDLIIAELTLTTPENLRNVAVVDLLPAGFEIENPRLQSRKGIEWIGETAYEPDYMDIRDDRLMIYGDLRAGQTHKFYYGIRVVTAGTFALPPVRAEAMYAPAKASVANSGQVTVAASGGL